MAIEQADPAYPFDPVGLGTLIFATGLFVAGEALGWPPREQVVEIFNRFPWRPADLAAGSGIGCTCNGEISPPRDDRIHGRETSSRTCPLDDMEDRLAQNRR